MEDQIALKSTIKGSCLGKLRSSASSRVFEILPTMCLSRGPLSTGTWFKGQICRVESVACKAVPKKLCLQFEVSKS